MSELPQDIDVQSVKKMLDEGTPFLLVDVREQDEHDFANISAARLLPMGTLPETVGELEEYKNALIVMHCHHGGRSSRAVAFLKEQGFTKVQNLAGGIHAWSEEIDPEVPVY